MIADASGADAMSVKPNKRAEVVIDGSLSEYSKRAKHSILGINIKAKGIFRPIFSEMEEKRRRPGMLRSPESPWRLEASWGENP